MTYSRMPFIDSNDIWHDDSEKNVSKQNDIEKNDIEQNAIQQNDTQNIERQQNDTLWSNSCQNYIDRNAIFTRNVFVIMFGKMTLVVMLVLQVRAFTVL